MTFYLQDREALSAGLRRIANEQLEKSMSQLTEGIKQDPSEAVHDVRKRFKKVRALLRLIRDEIGEEVYQQENTCFRDMGRQLADVRDARVRVKTLSNLMQHFEAAIATDAFADIQQALEHYHQSTRRYLLGEENVVDKILPSLKLAQERIATWPLSQDSWQVFDAGLKRVYKRGYKGMTQALETSDMGIWHNWRKRAKYLRYHIHLLRRLWPQALNEYEDHLHTLTNYLGDDHDLAMLKHFILGKPQRLQDSEHLDVLLALIDRRQQELRAAAGQLGPRLYAEKPKAFTHRFDRYWQIWRREFPPLP